MMTLLKVLGGVVALLLVLLALLPVLSAILSLTRRRTQGDDR